MFERALGRSAGTVPCALHGIDRVTHVIHPHTELRFISEEIGYGVVATKPIPRGTITWVLDRLDRVFSAEDVSALGDAYSGIIETYAYRNSRGEHVLCWDIARFVNHSFRANCLTTAYDFELAIRDIEPGEQLTDDYGYLNVDVPFTPVDEGTRRRTVFADDVIRYSRTWDRSLRAAFPRVPAVDQPLRAFMDDSAWSRCERVATGREDMVSIAANFFHGASPDARRPHRGST